MVLSSHALRYFVVFLVCTPFTLCAQLCNLSIAKEKVRQYYENGSYEADLKKIVSEVRAQFTNPALHAKQTVIIDIDETALSIYPWFKEYDFAMPEAFYYPCLQEKQFPATPLIKELYEHFRDLGYSIIFLTARQGQFYEKTYNNLMTEGYTTFEHVVMRAPEETEMSTRAYKELARCRLTEQGYEIVCCIDDNINALQGKHVGYAVHLPNYLYCVHDEIKDLID